MNENQLFTLTKQYAKKGVIHDELIPFFSQHGKWMGDRIRWRPDVQTIVSERMRHASLPKDRRFSRCRSGQILLTSYIWRSSGPAVIKYCEIRGSVCIASSAIVSAPALRKIGMSFYAMTTNSIHLPNLIEVGDSFESKYTWRMCAGRLRYVGGDIAVYGANLPALERVGGCYKPMWVAEVDAPNLVHVGAFLARVCDRISLPKLVSVERNLITCHQTEALSVPRLETIGLDLIAPRTPEIQAYCLRSVGGDINTLSAPGFFKANIHCGGTWYTYPGDVERWWAREAIQGREGMYL